MEILKSLEAVKRVVSENQPLINAVKAKAVAAGLVIYDSLRHPMTASTIQIDSQKGSARITRRI